MKKNSYKPLWAILLIIGLIAMFSTPQTQAGGTGAADFGVTNALINAAVTNSTTLGSGVVSVNQNETVDLTFYCATAITNTGTVTLLFGRVDVAGNVETTPRFTWAIPLASSTTNVYTRTNLPASLIGAATSLSLIEIRNPTAGDKLTNVAVKVEKKRFQAPN